jgi:chitinase
VLFFAGLLTFGLFQPMATSAAPALLSVQDKTVVEADTGTTTANVKIVLSKRLHKKVSVGYRTVDGDARAGSDYVAKSGRVKFAKGTRVAFVHVQIIGDKVEEADEHFKVRLFDAYRARIADRVAGVTIVDTDVTPPPPPPPPAKPALSVSDTKADEGEAAYFRVSLDKPAADVVTFRYATSDGTATAGQDYDSTSGVQSIDKGDSWVTIKVMTREDSLYEPGADETFFLNVFKVYNATVADGHGKAFIEDDDPPPPPKLFVKGDTVDEGGKVYFKVFLSEPAHHPVFFKYATDDGSALANKDYEPVSHYAVIGRYDRGVVIAVQTKEDPYDENLENFFLKVFDVKGAIPVDTRGEGLIVDDDPEPSLSISDDTDAPEGSKALVTVTLTEKSEKVVKVDWRTVGGGSAGGATNADFTADSGTLTFLPGETTKQVEVSIVANDGAEAAAETFYVRIENASNASISDPMGSVTIPPSTT